MGHQSRPFLVKMISKEFFLSIQKNLRRHFVVIEKKKVKNRIRVRNQKSSLTLQCIEEVPDHFFCYRFMGPHKRVVYQRGRIVERRPSGRCWNTFSWLADPCRTSILGKCTSRRNEVPKFKHQAGRDSKGYWCH